jgi:hypothetical protein
MDETRQRAGSSRSLPLLLALRSRPSRGRRRRIWCISTASANRRRPVTTGLLNARLAAAFDSVRRCGSLLPSRASTSPPDAGASRIPASGRHDDPAKQSPRRRLSVLPRTKTSSPQPRPAGSDLLALRSPAPLRPGARPWCAAVTSSLPVGAWRSCVPPRHQQLRPRAGARR